MTDLAPPPYADLGPDLILDALNSVGLPADGRLLALNSFENRVYQAGVDDAQPVIAKFYRPNRWSDEAIQEEHAFTLELAQREIPVVPPLTLHGATLHRYGGFRFAVYPRRGGRMPEFERRETLEWMGRFIGRIHAVGAVTAFRHRPTLDIASFGTEPRDFLLHGGWLPPALLPVWKGVVDEALEGVRRCFDRAGAYTSIRLHGDCHAGNVLWVEWGTEQGPHFVDFDDSRMGPAVQDLWMLLSGEREQQIAQFADVLTGYEDFMEFDPRQAHLIEALRTLRLIHYSAWIARRWDDPAFPAGFPWFGTARYWQDRILELREQVALMSESPLRPVGSG